MADKNDEQRIFEFTEKKYKELQKRYKEAVADKEETFMFGDHELVTAYAKYMLEYYEFCKSGNKKKGGKK